MPLADMRTLVYQNLIDLFLGMAVGMQKYQPEKRKRTAGLFNRCTRTLRIKVTSDRRASNKMLLNCTKNGTIRQLHRSNKDKKYREVTNHANLFGEHCQGLLSFRAKWLNTFV